MFGLLCLTLLSTVLGHQCGVGEDWQPTIHKYPHSGRQLETGLDRGADLKPLRLHFEYLDLNMDSSQETILKDQVMPAVMHWFNTTLKVYPLTANLVVSISECNGASVPADHQSTGIPDTDFVVYITGSAQGSAAEVAVGGTCLQDSAGRKNPLAGSFAINTDAFFSSDTTLAQQIIISMHELTHALVFSSDLFSDFTDSNGDAYASDGVVKTVTLSDRSKTATIVTLPNVLSEAAAFFSCNELEGLELEDYGGTGVAGNHWEAKIVREDYMTAEIPEHPALSALTLALFGDSGWYSVDTSRAQPMIWGKDEGCDWVNKKCIVDGTPSDGFCIDDTNDDCDFYSLGKGKCNLKEYDADLDTPYQYFSDLKKGGSDAYSDYCPTVKADKTKICTDPNTSVDSNYGEVAGSSSRCMKSSIVSSSLGESPTDAPRCYEVKCESDKLYVIIDGTSYECAYGNTLTVSNYDGSITCPQVETVCGRTPCPDFCFGQGTCSKGVCTCDDGFAGTSCSVKCDSKCKTCDESATSTCLSCYDTAEVQDGTCVCPSGYEFDAVNKVCKEESTPITGCADSCNGCATETTCEACYEGASLDTEGNCKCDNSDKTFNPDTKKCEFTCDAMCNGCVSNTECDSCYDTATKNTEGLCECPSKTVWNSGEMKCDSCAANCTDCSAANVCTTCSDANAGPVEGICRCNSRFYLKDTTCEACGDNAKECDANGAISCDDNYFLYNDGTTKTCKSCSASCNSCTSDPECYQCGAQGTTSGSTCADVSVGYKSKFSNGILTITFAEDLSKTLTKKNFQISTSGSTIDTSSWTLTKVSDKEYTIETNLKKSDLPISVVLDFNQE
ncbi:WIF1_2 [Blepharisma stoltei]|uniref:EGF-like domain-containing protein n=1 Tax=Blepharisma stoltei TaxID=1481888 RepID=A0AAU9IUM1_9CILI|nr:unnamed protein product [Blepharisma stoltei]